MVRALSLTISGMNCDHCVASIEQALRTLDGVIGCDVRVGGALVEIVAEKVARAALFARIREAGAFDVTSFTVADD